MRLAARVVAVLGAIAVAWLLLGGGPRHVTVVYDVSAVPLARTLEVEVRRGPELLRRSEFRLAGRDGRVSQTLQLPDGDYLLRGWIEAPGGVRPFERPLEVRESGTVVLPVGR